MNDFSHDIRQSADNPRSSNVQWGIWCDDKYLGTVYDYAVIQAIAYEKRIPRDDLTVIIFHCERG